MKIIETMVGLRYKYPVRGYQLEVLVEDLFKFYGCDTRRTAYTQDSNYDIYAEKDGKKFYIERGYSAVEYRTKKVCCDDWICIDIMEKRAPDVEKEK